MTENIRKNVIVTGKVDVLGTSKAKLMGREFTVLPATMMVEGSYYPAVDKMTKSTNLFFSADDLRASVSSWNGRPVAVNHPDGQETCNCPSVYDDQWLGYVFNAKFDEKTKSLKSDLWIDDERGKFITNRVKAGEQIDVSIGAFGDLLPPRNVPDGAKYDYKMSNIVGDHLAILPDGKGACSWKDGCGVRASVFAHSVKQPDNINEVKPVSIIKGEEMTDCVETKVAPVQKIEVTAKVEDGKRLSLNEMLDRMDPSDRHKVEAALKNQEDSKKRYLKRIGGCKTTTFCSKALDKVDSLELLESIADLVDLSAKEPEKAVVEASEPITIGKTNFLMQGSGEVPTNDTWAPFKDVTWEQRKQ